MEAFVILASVAATLPGLVILLTLGRDSSVSGATPIATSSLSTAFDLASAYLLVGTAVMAVFVSRSLQISLRGLCIVIIVLIPQTNDLIAKGTLSAVPALVCFVVVAVTLGLIPHSPDLRVFGAVAGGYVVISGLLLFLPSAWMGSASYAAKGNKGIVTQSLYAGATDHSNILGIILALAIPLLTTVKRKPTRLLLITIAAALLLLTSSRSAIIALCISGVLTKAATSQGQLRRPLAVLVTLLSFSVGTMLPFFISNPHAFTDRGAIWIAARQLMQGRILHGVGFGGFGTDSNFALMYNLPVAHGHNQFITFAIIGGVALVAVWIGVAVCALVSILKANSVGGFWYLICLLLCGLTETPLRLDTFSQSAFISVLPLFFLATATVSSTSASDAGGRYSRRLRLSTTRPVRIDPGLPHSNGRV
ncbi:O-antigen ligase family protein [Gordonia polyisoprenivorans]|uniref:O-antigen ligase family protein n=1 Tax=Gordonia polyisoprenivorans TaxID=84595 RepID=UPI001B8D9280|nr:O-antigen ligase family protein [Gordonia polyisoprenivorans]QUD81707.1 O-antigen ligase family protein [Gordonia polyisoprenivorans]